MSVLERSDRAQHCRDLIAIWQLFKTIADLGVGIQRQQRRRNPEGADSQPVHFFDGGNQGTGIIEAELTESVQLSGAIELLDNLGRCASETDLCLIEQAAET
jgi:hypothetical protein